MDLTKVEKFKIPANISSAIIFSYQTNNLRIVKKISKMLT